MRPAVSGPAVPGALQAYFITCLVVATLMGCCVAYNTLGVVAQQVLTAQMSELAGGAALDPVSELYETMRVVSVVMLILQMIACGVLLGVGVIGLTGSPLAKPLGLAGLGVFAMLTLLDGGVSVWSWYRAQEIMSSTMTGVSDEEAGMMAMISGLGLVPTGCWLFLKLGVAATGVGVLASREASEFYGRASPGTNRVA